MGITELAAAAGLKTEQVKQVIEVIKNTTRSGDKITLQGFGTFVIKTRAARNGKNPQTGEPITIPAKTVLTFKATKKN